MDDVEMNNLLSSVLDEHQNIQGVEADRRHGKEVEHGFEVISEQKEYTMI